MKNLGTSDPPDQPRLAFHSTHCRSSLGWLLGALLLGGVPVIVYFTTPGAPKADLVFAVIVGLPLFVMALREVGESTSILLFPSERRLVCVEGFFRKRKFREYSFTEFSRVELIRCNITSEGGGSSWLEVHLCLARGGELRFETSNLAEARRCVSEVSQAIGVPAFDPGNGHTVDRTPPSPDNVGRKKSTPIIVIVSIFMSFMGFYLAMKALIRK